MSTFPVVISSISQSCRPCFVSPRLSPSQVAVSVTREHRATFYTETSREEGIGSAATVRCYLRHGKHYAAKECIFPRTSMLNMRVALGNAVQGWVGKKWNNTHPHGAAEKDAPTSRLSNAVRTRGGTFWLEGARAKVVQLVCPRRNLDVVLARQCQYCLPTEHVVVSILGDAKTSKLVANGACFRQYQGGQTRDRKRPGKSKSLQALDTTTTSYLLVPSSLRRVEFLLEAGAFAGVIDARGGGSPLYMVEGLIKRFDADKLDGGRERLQCIARVLEQATAVTSLS